MNFQKLIVLTILSVTLGDETCYLPLDVMFLQDTTGSFDDDLPNVVAQIPNMVAQILSNHPNSYFGVAEFKDKPYKPWGEFNDFCYKLNGALSPDVNEFSYAYSGLYASGGSDLPEAHYHALIDVALDTAVGWRQLARQGLNATTNEAGARLIIMSTDAEPHLPGDYAKYPNDLYPYIPRNLEPSSGGIVEKDVTYSCIHEDYPNPQQVQQVLASQKIYLAILTPNDSEITGAWHWVNENLLGQPMEFYQYISSDSSDLIDGVLRAIDAVTLTACATTTELPSTLTTTEPSTSSPTTDVPVANSTPSTLTTTTSLTASTIRRMTTTATTTEADTTTFIPKTPPPRPTTIVTSTPLLTTEAYTTSATTTPPTTSMPHTSFSEVTMERVPVANSTPSTLTTTKSLTASTIRRMTTTATTTEADTTTFIPKTPPPRPTTIVTSTPLLTTEAYTTSVTTTPPTTTMPHTSFSEVTMERVPVTKSTSDMPQHTVVSGTTDKIDEITTTTTSTTPQITPLPTSSVARDAELTTTVPIGTKMKTERTLPPLPMDDEDAATVLIPVCGCVMPCVCAPQCAGGVQLAPLHLVSKRVIALTAEI
eukprot:Blabericola_migrator_1__3774@NODE_2132_length_3226_cov_718_199747_g1351_i0_p1_GENE_NODE_2132_length_3226_cov_718_199747_g1351_i0NODE_2132_length_3226_cov_718_199747_g1351_i0_p1_ORF_typecomplete_len594_score77_44Integrin_beta/PF00362_18/1_3e28VWA/PF00092_28/4_2e05_NODE_2132_length_3226_cov_718_199747_g1351_i06922473